MFLAPGEAGVDPTVLGRAAQGQEARLVQRLRAALPAAGWRDFDRAAGAEVSPAIVAGAARQVVDRLFWVLLYWHDPAGYDELVAGEAVHPRVLDTLELDGRTVCDVGAGTGRFTLLAARRAASVVAVDAIPPLLHRLQTHLGEQGIGNVEVRRGSFASLPLKDGSVDLAVACSSVTSREPFGGQPALTEMERIVRPGGEVAVIWPDRPDWFRERGFVHLSAAGNESLHFTDPAAAERLVRAYYSDRAARWVARHRTADVPYRILGVSPPNDVCIKVAGTPRA